MAKPRELKRRIRSVQNTKKITKTMELVFEKDHQDDGARLHVEAQARPGPRGGRASLRAGAGGGDRPALLARACRAISAAAPAGPYRTRRGSAACGAALDHVESRAVRRVQRESDSRSAPAAGR